MNIIELLMQELNLVDIIFMLDTKKIDREDIEALINK